MNDPGALVAMAGLANLGELIFRGLTQSSQRKRAKEGYEQWKSARKPVSLPSLPSFIPGMPDQQLPPISPSYTASDYADLVAAVGDNPYGQEYLTAGQLMVNATDQRNQRADRRRQEAQQRRREMDAATAADRERMRDSNLKALEMALNPAIGGMRMNPDLAADPERYMEILRTLSSTGALPATVRGRRMGDAPEAPIEESRRFEMPRMTDADIPVLTAAADHQSRADLTRAQYFTDPATMEVYAVAPDVAGQRFVRIPISNPGEALVRAGTQVPRRNTGGGVTGKYGRLTRAQIATLEKLHQRNLQIGRDLKALSGEYGAVDPKGRNALEARRRALETEYNKNKAQIHGLETAGGIGGGQPALEINPITGEPIPTGQPIR